MGARHGRVAQRSTSCVQQAAATPPDPCPSSPPPAPPAQVEGVGTGAIKAAAEHGSFDLDKLATWKEGEPVPFAFLADTFEAIGEESKVRRGQAPCA